MAILRYVILSFLVFGFSHAKAETIAASTQAKVTQYCTGQYCNRPVSSAQEACTYTATLGYSWPSGAVVYDYSLYPDRPYCYNPAFGAPDYRGFVISTIQSCPQNSIDQNGVCMGCPSTGGWTLNNAQCTRPDCPSGQTRDSSGNCVSECTQKAQQPATYAWFKSTVGGSSIEGSYCDGSCTVGVNPAPTGTAYNNGREKIQRYQIVTTAAPCTSSTLPTKTDPANEPPEPPKKPVCLPTEGVLTSTSGTIACVPPGVPTQSVPEVKKAKSVEQFPDGSTRTTETTYTKDPVSQVQDTKQTIITTGSTGGGAGQAGPVGTTTVGGSQGTSSAGNPSPETGTSDLCKNNPGLQICKGGMNEEVTQKQVKVEVGRTAEAAEKIRDSVSADGFDPKSHIPDSLDASDSAKKTLSDKVDEVKGGLSKFGGSEDPARGRYDQFVDAMGGWFEPISMAGCAPFDSRIGPFSWHFDHCDVAAKISAIGAYCMWILLLFGVFAMVTKEGK